MTNTLRPRSAIRTFTVWAPKAATVKLRIGDRVVPMAAANNGWWTADTETATDEDYGFLLDDSDELLADPRSLWQPDGVHGPSRLYDHDTFDWVDSDWEGRDLLCAVIYELHIGTFTPGGTFDSAIERLDHLADLGVTHVEILPVNAFNGVWNWGYDGVDWYAVHAPYGGPDGFKQFVEACHARQLAVILDVVYNHLGPSGNVLPKFGPYLKTGSNTWGDLLNLEEPEVRRFIIDNALMWLRDFHVDGLRLDAVHALVDSSTPHLLAQLAAEVEELSIAIGKPLPLIAESDLNDPIMITSRAEGGYGLTAQWDDDVHHALHALLTGERQGYYCDFGSLDVLAKTITSAFLHDGTFSTFRGRSHGRPVDRARTCGYQFVVALQNHDQVGNRAVGDRLPELTSPDLLRVGALLLLTMPFTPMLWMGEEWAASTRWPFFTSHPEPELAVATGKGRVEEFAEHGWDTDAMIDPQDPAAYRAAQLNWDELEDPDHAGMLSLYRQLIALRRREPDLTGGVLADIRVDADDQGLLVIYRGDLRIVANFADSPQNVAVEVPGELVIATGYADLHRDGVNLAGQSAAIVRRGSPGAEHQPP